MHQLWFRTRMHLATPERMTLGKPLSLMDVSQVKGNHHNKGKGKTEKKKKIVIMQRSVIARNMTLIEDLVHFHSLKMKI